MLSSAQGKARVLVVTQNLLLGDVLESLLDSVFTLPAHRVMRVGADALLEGIDQFRPEVVVLEEGLVGNGSSCLLSQLLKYGRIRIILVNLEKNRLHVYDTFPVSLIQSTDFITLIENFPGGSLKSASEM